MSDRLDFSQQNVYVPCPSKDDIEVMREPLEAHFGCPLSDREILSAYYLMMGWELCYTALNSQAAELQGVLGHFGERIRYQILEGQQKYLMLATTDRELMLNAAGMLRTGYVNAAIAGGQLVRVPDSLFQEALSASYEPKQPVAWKQYRISEPDAVSLRFAHSTDDAQEELQPKEELTLTLTDHPTRTAKDGWRLHTLVKDLVSGQHLRFMGFRHASTPDDPEGDWHWIFEERVGEDRASRLERIFGEAAAARTTLTMAYPITPATEARFLFLKVALTADDYAALVAYWNKRNPNSLAV